MKRNICLWSSLIVLCIVTGCKSKPTTPITSRITKGFLARSSALPEHYAADEILVQFKPQATAADRSRVYRLLGMTTTQVVTPRPISIAAHAMNATRPKPTSIGSSDVNLVTLSANGKTAMMPPARIHVLNVSFQQSPPARFALPSSGTSKKESSNGSSVPTDIATLLAEVRRDPAVFYAQPNYHYHITGQYPTNDSLYSQGTEWGVASSVSPRPIGPVTNQYGTGAEVAWSQARIGSKKVVVGVIDSGAETTHPDLTGNLDLAHAMDFYRNAGDPNYNQDENGHGTHVAGIVGAVGNNGIGISGVAWQVSIIPVKFIGPDGNGDTANAVRAFNYLINLKQQGVNLVAINASWATSDSDPLLLASIKKAARAGIITVSAASNEGKDLGQNPMYPASFDTSTDDADASGTLPFDSNITVAAIDSYGQRASFSNYGGTVALAAPGVGIVSTIIPHPDSGVVPDLSAIITETNGGTYVALDGTSMAAPYVTGAIALVASFHLDQNGHTTISASDLCSQIMANAKSTATPSMNNITRTGGRLDISKLAP